MREKFLRIILIVLLVLVAILTVAALYIKDILEVNIKGTVNVKSTVIEVNLDIDSREGEKTIFLGTQYIPKGAIIVKPQLVGYEENFTLTLNGELELTSSSHRYRVLMPCLISIREPCYRIASIIPGYDESLAIEEGTYNIAFIVKWNASGTGRFYLKLFLEYHSS